MRIWPVYVLWSVLRAGSVPSGHSEAQLNAAMFRVCVFLLGCLPVFPHMEDASKIGCKEPPFKVGGACSLFARSHVHVHVHVRGCAGAWVRA